MGRGIAHAAALGGYRTILEDLLPGALRKAESEIRVNLDKAVELGKVAAADADAALQRLEVVRALETDDDTLATAVEVGKRMGKEVVVIKESPGFITSRINAMIGNEAFCILQEGIASAADIDKALKLGLNHPMGPFELVDLVGLDTRLNILEYLHKSLGDKYRPAPLLVQYVKAGRLGRKSGRGVYEYPEPKNVRAAVETRTPVSGFPKQ